jgi:hypothetical protein
MWGTGKAKHGRKYITRALDENLPKYQSALQATAAQP